MKKIAWKNHTKKHPNGVCEAATTIWLEQISKKGISTANKIKPKDCDVRQKKIEENEYTWMVDLSKGLSSRSAFDAYNRTELKKEANITKALKGMNNGDFFFINAINPSGDGHALALFKDSKKIYFFDPNKAIYIYDKKDEIASRVWENTMSWSTKVMMKGTIPSK